MKRHRVAACLFALLMVTSGVMAAAQEREGMPIRVQDAVRMALERNLDLAIERLNVPIAHEQIRQAEGQFDPLLGVGANYSHQKRFPNNTLEQDAINGRIRDDIVSPNSSVTGKLITGTQYNFSLSGPYDKSDNPIRLFDESYQGNLSLGLTQPLLQNFGIEVNLVTVRIAEKTERQSLSNVEGRMLQVMRDVESRYWAVFYVQEHVKVARGNLELAEDLVLRLERGLGSGVATALDVTQAKTAVEARRADLIRARADLTNARANLRLVVDPKGDPLVPLAATEGPLPEGPPKDLGGLQARAVAARPELRSQALAIEKLALQELQAKNNTLPSLNATGSVGYNGLAGKGFGPGVRTPSEGPLLGRDNYLDAYKDFFQTNGNFNWSAGLVLQIPIGNRQALAVLEQVRLQRQQEELRLTLMRTQVGVEVETAFQDTIAGWGQFEAAREGVRLAREQLAAMEKNQRSGLATVRQLLEAQQNLGNALDGESVALATYATGRSRLEAASTTSFQRYRIVMRP